MQMTIYIYIYLLQYTFSHWPIYIVIYILYTYLLHLLQWSVALSRAIQGQYITVESDSLKHSRDVLVKLGFHIFHTSSMCWWLWWEGCTCKYWITSGKQICKFPSIMNWLHFAAWWKRSLWWLVFSYKVVICD